MGNQSYDLDLAAYALDDLNVARQDDFPLDDKEKRGPSFTPRIRNGTDHIPKKHKLELQAAWGNPIRDAESEQMKGLEIEGPSYRGNAMRATLNPILPRASNGTRPHPMDRPLHDNAKKSQVSNTTDLSRKRRQEQEPTGNRIQKKLDSIGRPSASAQTSCFPPVGQCDVRKAVSAQPSPAKNAGRQSPASNTTRPRASVADCELTLRPPPEGPFDAWTCYAGFCMIYPTPKTEDGFMAKFEMRMTGDLASPEATIYLTAKGLPTRVHDVLELKSPELYNDYCIICTKGPAPDASYRIQLKDRITTQLFAQCLLGLQKHINHMLSNGSDNLPEATSNEQATAAPSEELQATTPSIQDLVDVNDPPLPSDGSELVKNINDVLEAIGRLTKQLGTKYQLSDSMKVMEMVLHKKWTKIHGSEGDMALKALLQVFSALLKFQEKCNTQSEYPVSIRDFLKPITYTSTELAKFKSAAVLPTPKQSEESKGCVGEKKLSEWEKGVWKSHSAASGANSQTTPAANATSPPCSNGTANTQASNGPSRPLPAKKGLSSSMFAT